ncbi:MAG: transcription antitermination factor NusB [Candidatus Babeliales bacterium]
MNNTGESSVDLAMAGNDWEQSLSQRDRRSVVFHLLYLAESYEYSGSVPSFADNLNRGFDLSISLNGPLVAIAEQVVDRRDELDTTYQPLLANWRLERLSVCTKLILRYAVWELLHTDTNPTIVINEAIELAKAYAEKDSYKLVNGLLDQLVKQRGLKREPIANQQDPEVPEQTTV